MMERIEDANPEDYIGGWVWKVVDGMQFSGFVRSENGRYYLEDEYGRRTELGDGDIIVPYPDFDPDLKFRIKYPR
jgi:hypothetical protein